MKALIIASLALAWGRASSLPAASTSYADVYAARLMHRLDKDRCGGFEKAESERDWARLKDLDTNQNGTVSLEELKDSGINYLETGGERKLNILYKETPEEDLYLDLYYPVGKRDSAISAVVYSPGGGWAAGSKQGAANASFAKVFQRRVDAGFGVASVNYRLVRKGADVSMRDCVIDAKDAVRYLAKNGESLGIDAQRFYVMGDSAGGQIAQILRLSSSASLLGDPALADTPYRMVAGVSWYGPCDFEKTELFNHDDRENFNDRVGQQILPRDSAPEDKLALYREMSPVNYLKTTSPPLLMIQGDKDTTIPVKHAYYMQEKAEKLSVPVEIMIVENAGHNWRRVDADINPTREEIIERTGQFFIDHF